MSTETETEASKRRLTVEVTQDRLEAWIRLACPDDPRPMTPEEILEELTTAKIAVDDSVRARITEGIRICVESETPPGKLLMAKGRPAVEGKDGDFVAHEDLQRVEHAWQGDAKVNYYTFNSIVTVVEGQTIGTLVPPVPGTDGVDVHGTVLKPNRRPKEVQLDASAKVSPDDPLAVLAVDPGKVSYENGKLSINRVFMVKKDVDFETGHIDSSVDVHIPGTVRDRFIVKSAGTVSVCGAIEAGTVEAKGDVIVRGGVLQRGKGSTVAGGEIIARFCDEADLRACGDVKITTEVMNSRVHCEGMLHAAGASIIGGHIYAHEGVEIAVIGSDAFVRTEIIVGLHPDVVREAEKLRGRMKTKREAIERARQAVQPYIADINRLLPAQKKEAKKLLSQIDALSGELAQIEQHRTDMLDAARAKGIPYVLVREMIRGGSSIQIGRRRTTFRTDFAGPVRIEKHKIRNVTEFVAVNQLSGSVRVLPSTYIEDEKPACTAQSKDDPAQENKAPDGSGG